MSSKGSRPALTREARENQLIDLAIDQVEKQLREGTASSQVLVHYLKLASTREKREKEKMEAETEKGSSGYQTDKNGDFIVNGAE